MVEKGGKRDEKHMCWGDGGGLRVKKIQTGRHGWLELKT